MSSILKKPKDVNIIDKLVDHQAPIQMGGGNEERIQWTPWKEKGYFLFFTISAPPPLLH